MTRRQGTSRRHQRQGGSSPRWCAALLAWGLALAALAWPFAALAAVVIQDERGGVLRFEQPPQRIVSLLPSLTESVCALGACDRLVGTDRYSNWPPAVRRLPKLGGLEDAQIEAIVALRPDVVLAARSSRAIQRFEALGLKVLTLEPVDHAQLRKSLDTLADLLGQATRSAQLWRDIEAQLQRAAGQVPPALRGQRVYFEVDGAPYAAGAVSFVGQTLVRLGLGNVVPEALGPFPKLNPEFVLRAQPDIVMAVSRDLIDMAARPGWSHLQALQRGRVCSFETEAFDMLVRPGPRMGEGAQLIADCLRGWAPTGGGGAGKSPGHLPPSSVAAPAAKGAAR